MNIKRIISSVGIGAGAIIIGLGIQIALANWIPAPGSPPNCSDPSIPGCNAPINVGTSAQAKQGGLGLGTTTAPNGYTLDVEAPGAFISTLLTQGLTLADGNSNETGYVLTNSNGSGLAKWQMATGGSGGTAGVTSITPASGYDQASGGNTTITPTSGTGAVTIAVSGTVGGACFYVGGSDWQTTYYGWGKGIVSGYGTEENCSCADGYTLEPTGPGIGGEVELNSRVPMLCIKD
jgi:hypothetical protein